MFSGYIIGKKSHKLPGKCSLPDFFCNDLESSGFFHIAFLHIDFKSELLKLVDPVILEGRLLSLIQITFSQLPIRGLVFEDMIGGKARPQNTPSTVDVFDV